MRSEAKTCAVSPQAYSKGRIPVSSVADAPSMSAAHSAVPIHRLRRERREADGDVLGLLAGRRVPNTLSSPRDDGFSRSPTSTTPSPDSTRTTPRRTIVYSSNSGVCAGSFHPAEATIRAMLTSFVPELTRPTNSSMTFGGSPGTAIRVGRTMCVGMRPS